VTTCEEDVVAELLGHDRVHGIATDPPTLRVDLTLAARAPHEKPLPMPQPKAWAEWIREVRGRLERIEPLIPAEDVRVNGAGLLEVLAWQQEPTVTARCSPTGELLLQAVEVSAGQLIALPRVLDDSERAPDEGPEQQLRELFHRIRASLTAWMQAVDHLRAG
jgi:hypothetical protein